MKVTIEVTRRVRYSTTVDIPEEDYVRLYGYLEGTRDERQKAESEIDGMIDASDWVDDELDDIDTFQAVDPEDDERLGL